MTTRVVVIPVGEPPQVRDVEDTLASYQALVGGYVERVVLSRDKDGSAIDLVLNEEGLLRELPVNMLLKAPSDVAAIVGDCFCIRADSNGQWVSLTEEDIRNVREWVDTQTVRVVTL